ncbi:ROK family transcriptional regulator [Jiangella endophytica]|uniref:ROK family transcriptional regulator n=1 Tax=Jiangella endophytica TaxID=1623398 RepID=UPI000E3483C6|nr:ROK family transcriptional regulator [Jiangella endophytica]
MALGSTVRDLRRRNRALVLRTIVLAGETTRAEIATTCGLSTATITNVVTELMSDGLVQEVGSVPSNGGRPIARLSTRAEGAYLIGADVGENGVMVELFDLSLSTVDRVFVELPATVASPADVGRSLTDAVETILGRRSDVRDRVMGMGLGVPGLVERSGERATIYAQSLGWAPTAVDDLVTISDLPVQADNGAKTLTMAEQWFGAARGVDDCVVALVGRGIGAGIISDGQLLRGRASSAGEFGHTKISVDGPECACGGRGCVEAYVGGGSVVARWRATADASGAGLDDLSDEEAFARLLEAADAGTSSAAAIVDDAVGRLGIGLANLVNLTNPEKIILGGWAGLPLHAARGPQLSEAIRRHSLARPGEQFTLEPAAMGGDAVALGAALLSLEQLIEGLTPLPKVPT